jgi:hypothetical protein
VLNLFLIWIHIFNMTIVNHTISRLVTKLRTSQQHVAVCTYVCIIYFLLIKIIYIWVPISKLFYTEPSVLSWSMAPNSWDTVSSTVDRDRNLLKLQHVHFQINFTVNVLLCNAVYAAELTCCKAGWGVLLLFPWYATVSARIPSSGGKKIKYQDNAVSDPSERNLSK